MLSNRFFSYCQNVFVDFRQNSLKKKTIWIKVRNKNYLKFKKEIDVDWIKVKHKCEWMGQIFIWHFNAFPSLFLCDLVISLSLPLFLPALICWCDIFVNAHITHITPVVNYDSSIVHKAATVFGAKVYKHFYVVCVSAAKSKYISFSTYKCTSLFFAFSPLIRHTYTNAGERSSLLFFS